MQQLSLYVASQAAHEREVALTRRLEHDRAVRARSSSRAVPVRTRHGLGHGLLVRLHLVPAPVAGPSL